jgi:hypothetical protein
MMTTAQYPRSIKEQVAGLCHLGRLIDKVRMRNAGLIQDYNYLTLGFDKYLLDKLGIKGEDFEQRVLQGGADEEIAEWVQANGKTLTDQEKAEWNQMALTFSPKNEQGQRVFDNYKAEIARKRGVSIDQLPRMTSWFELIEHDEGRM